MTKPRAKREVETMDYAGFMRRTIRAMGLRVGAGDIAALPEMVALRDELDTAIDETIRSLRDEPWQYSWAQIGSTLGMSRQAAQKRWGHLEPKSPRRTGGQPANRR